MLEYENYIDIFNKLGFKLQWRTNNGDCKGVCGGITDYIEGEGDEGLMDSFDEFTKAENNVVFLHLRGSHGTEYYKQYPPEFEYYKPVCKQKELRKCSDEEIMNAYDNSIRYTMYLVSNLIDKLREKQGYNIGVVFVSDHGEAIGENGFYLHGTPYFMTKEIVGKVLSFMWFNDSWYKEFEYDKQCMKSKENEKVGHYNMFSTILKLMKIKNDYIRDDDDIFKTCY
jgi:lipid A ethanolaminephosphotransferase